MALEAVGMFDMPNFYRYWYFRKLPWDNSATLYKLWTIVRIHPSIHGWCSVCFCDCPFLVFSWSQADSEKTKSALWPLMIGELFSFENNWLCEGNCCWKKVTIFWKGSKFVDLYIKEKLNKFLGLQVTQLFWGRVVRAKSRQRKRHRLNVVLIKNDSLSKIFFGSYFF